MASPQAAPNRSELADYGLVECTLRFDLEEGVKPDRRTANYVFQIRADGVLQRFSLGKQVAIQTTINNSISTNFLNGGAAIGVSAHILPQSERVAWFTFDIEYNRLIERLATLPSYQNLPDIDTSQLKTEFAMAEGRTEQIFEYRDPAIGRKLSALFGWKMVSPPKTVDSFSPPASEKLRCMFRYLIGSNSIEYTFLTSPDGKEHRVLWGIEIPFETNVNNTSMITYVTVGVGAVIRASQENPAADYGAKPDFRFQISASYGRVLNRASSQKAEAPYVDRVEFNAFLASPEGKETLIFNGQDPVQGKNFEARFTWRRGNL
jgi:hypothetical protein